MRFWFSPLPLPATLILELAAAGLEPWQSEQGSPHGAPCLLVYDSPDRHIAAAVETEVATVFSAAALAEGYTQLLGCRQACGQPLLAGWRLERVGSLGLEQWLAGDGPSYVVGDAEPISSLVASVILSLLDTQPQLLETYSDLELQAELLGSEADLAYRQRLHLAIRQADPLPALVAAIHTREGELQEARHEAEQTREELQQVQAEHQALKQELQPKVDNLVQQLQIRDRELQAECEEAELNMQKLHQVMEELEKQCLADLQKQQLLDTRDQEVNNLQAKLEKLERDLLEKVAILEQQHLIRSGELRVACDEAEVNRIKLHQVEEQMEEMRLADLQKQQLLDTRDQEVNGLQAKLEKLEQDLIEKVAILEQQLMTRGRELKEARNDAECNLIQLHQVQEELEQLFLADRQKRQLLETREQQLQTLKGEFLALEQKLQPKVAILEQQLMTRGAELKEARNDAQLNLIRLHQAHEELEKLFMADLHKRQLLETHNEEHRTLSAEFMTQENKFQLKVADLEQQLLTRGEELQDARKEAELNRMQLTQAQEELEHYSLQSRAGRQLVQAQRDQLNRAKILLTKLAMHEISPNDNFADVAVEVLPPAVPMSEQPSLQVQALLKSYAGSLHRANALLSQAMRRQPQ